MNKTGDVSHIACVRTRIKMKLTRSDPSDAVASSCASHGASNLYGLMSMHMALVTVMCRHVMARGVSPPGLRTLSASCVCLNPVLDSTAHFSSMK